MPSSVITAPPMSMRCVGPQSVTSWPKSRCQKSSSGNAMSANRPVAHMSTPPSGAYQSRAMRIAVGPGRSARSSRPRQIAKKPDAKMPYRPARMKKWPGLENTPGSRPRSMCSETSQYRPNTAEMSEMIARPHGSEAQAG